MYVCLYVSVETRLRDARTLRAGGAEINKISEIKLNISCLSFV